MKKVGLLTREKIVEELKERLDNSQACFFISFKQVNAFRLNEIRNSLGQVQTSVFVARNSLVKRALNDAGLSDLDGLIEEETGVAFVQDSDVVNSCKILVDFTKENENLKIRGAYLGDKKLSAGDVVTLSKLPSREVLLGMAVSTMAAPLKGFMSALNQVILKFVWAIKEIKNKKEKQ